VVADQDSAGVGYVRAGAVRLRLYLGVEDSRFLTRALARVRNDKKYG
jgi:hypothetical protein